MDDYEILDDEEDPVYVPDEVGPDSKCANILRTSDYNLNSPLIEDPADMMLTWLMSGERPKRMNGSPGLDRSYHVLKNLSRKVDWGRTQYGSKGSQTFINRWAEVCSMNNRQAREHLRELAGFCKKTSHVEKVFTEFLEVRGFHVSLGSILESYSKINYDQEGGRYIGNLYHSYMIFHVIVLYMNALDWEEEKMIISLWSKISKYEAKYDRMWISDKIWGLLLITKEFVYHRDLDILVDKNFILMMKDMFLSRFNSISVLLSPADDRYSKDIIYKMISLYKAGDTILSLKGNKGYEAIKMLEPIVTNLLVKEAESFRPLIHKLGEFPEYMEEKSNQLIGLFGKPVKDFFDELKSFNNIHDLVFVFGCYRHWGHPYIDYRSGLSKLYDQVHMKKDIDSMYQNALASDLTKKILRWGFEKYSRWFVDISQLPKDHLLKPYMLTQTWPPIHIIDQMKETWHKLPVTKIFETPESMDPSETLDDKSHSFDRRKFETWLREHPGRPIPSEKVIITALSKDPVNPLEFLQKVDKDGLDFNDLIIGLKPKERELKIEGRFFALMSWNLRLYFVITEKLLADKIIPLFDSLTMTDNLNRVFKKLIDRVNGQGLEDYQRVTYAFHLDYEKWNNHQRMESTKDVFQVLDRFFGFHNVFSRTHEFFQKSWIYYTDRADLIGVWDNKIFCRDVSEGPVCWNGQEGGLEGLRQKGWSLVSLLMIEREALVRNTRTKILAQGDNQVLCPTYHLSEGLNKTGLEYELDNIARNASAIYRAIEEGARKLGLIIKKEETMCSFDFMIYGKTPLFRGNILVPESKRWARVSCISNDQIVSLSNIMSTVSTNALTVAQHSQSLVKPMRDYLLMSVQAVYHYLLFSPLLKNRVYSILILRGEKFIICMARILFLDPSLGGVSGTSLGRFHVRQFPDPVTEGLAFWKELGDFTKTEWIKKLSNEAGNPRLGQRTLDSFSKLMEDPTCLNIEGGSSPMLILREAIRKALYDDVDKIKNAEFREAILLSKNHRDNFLVFLRKIKPLFPRFLSELFSSSFLGIPESIIGLIQNSRTVRRQFKKGFSQYLEDLFVRSESEGLSRVTKDPSKSTQIWRCSAERADRLREISWGSPVVGTTIPHPSEMLRSTPTTSTSCSCKDSGGPNPRISVSILSSFDNSFRRRGPLKGYLGSATSVSTQLFHSWEKVTNVHVVRKALALKESINWFVDRNSNLAESLLANIKSLTGANFEIEEAPIFKRTGSALHRFKSSRCSEGGYSAVCPNLLSYISVSTDTMSDLTQDGTNFDFMFQALMLYCQTWSSELAQRDTQYQDITLHWHIDCRLCLRVIDEVSLEAPEPFIFPDISIRISKMTSGAVPQFRPIPELKLPEGSFSTLPEVDKSFHMGTAQGLLYSILVGIHDQGFNDPSIFPVNIYKNLAPQHYLLGLARGIMIGASLCFLSRMTKINVNRPLDLFSGVISYIVLRLENHPSLYMMLKNPNLREEVFSIPQKVPAAYPTTMKEGNNAVINYLQNVIRYQKDKTLGERRGELLWVFSDFRSRKMTYLTVVTFQTFIILSKMGKSLSKQMRNDLTELNSLMRKVLGGCGEDVVPSRHDVCKILRESLAKTRWVDSEVRHASKFLTTSLPETKPKKRTESPKEWICSYQKIMIETSSHPCPLPRLEAEKLSSHVSNPLMSGLRVVQYATGAHYKIKPILNSMECPPQLCLVIGDGSGGISRAILSFFPDSLLVFNSLLEINDMMASGSCPLPPSAIMRSGRQNTDRVIGLNQIWEMPSDLRLIHTWIYFDNVQKKLKKDYELIVCDAEVTDVESSNKISENLIKMLKNVSGELTVIFKSYGSMLVDPKYSVLENLSSSFPKIEGYTTQVTSSFSSEIYLVCRRSGIYHKEREHLSAATVRELRLTCINCRDCRAEMGRARSLKYSDLIMGFPPDIISNPYTDLISTLIDSDVESFLVHRMVDDLELLRNRESKLSNIFAIMVIYSNRVFNVSKQMSGSHYQPPSDPKIVRHFNICLGTLLFLFTTTNNLTGFSKCHSLYNDKITYNFHKCNIKGKTFLSWSWTKKSSVKKCISVNTELSMSSHWIRIIYKIVQTTSIKSELSKILENGMKTLANYNKWISRSTLSLRTSLLENI
ncbi:TPA: RNA-dependent RNA polymerase [Anole lyssa-like virus 1]|uniref:Replicase n=1 Tax=Anole lyssa-like virus 1 TaxID=2772344 RepID=A0AAD3AVK4_9RHAB|nr:RNA-dependent RNA polymerase [Anole lyssa-like virus 1]FAA01392.1 TPA: RNA-dependent RNA polymerase [Anole lyssa-like virus 1]